MEDIFVKHHGSNVETDWKRVNLFSAIVEQLDDVRTARPRWMDTSKGTIGYERIEGLRPALARPINQLPIVMARIGKALAHLHAVREMDASPLSGVRAEDKEGAATIAEHSDVESGFFWGDCWHGNIFTDTYDRLVFIDPLPNRWLFPNQTYRASVLIDLAMLHMSIYFCHPLIRLLRLDHRRYRMAGEKLLESYEEAAKTPLTRSCALRSSREMALRYIDTYRARLPPPLAELKRRVSCRLVSRLDAASCWSNEHVL
ncbi:MAG TPA: hypothetical protein PJ986_07005 [Gammaproteobacteria bacterium]|nr:hypothetical protein [Gammaproteobacteria bacterium]